MQKINFTLGIMKCFSFSSGDRPDEVKTTTKSSSLRSSSSTSTADREVRRLDSDVNSQNASEISNESSSRRTSFTCLSQRANSNLIPFTFAEMKKATKNFSRSFMIGEGGFGSVFRGTIQSLEDPQKKIIIAVKQLSRTGMQGHKEWVTEVSVLGVVEHPNLVKLLGYCADDDERGIQRLLVYEYMPNKSVQDHLSKRHQPPLSWTTRLKIAQDAARGLAYLHEGMGFQIIFRDFKSSNILLDDQWNAKLSDFGLARLGPEHGVSHVSTAVVGTIGYAAPEYVHTGHLTYKSDVWSYGVFLYELITGRCPVDRNRPKDERKLLEWIRPHLSDMRKFRMIIDPKMENNFSLKSVQMLAVVANKCLVRQPRLRPKMSQVLLMVDQIVEMPPQKEDDGLPSSKSKGKNLLKRRFVENLMGGNRWLLLRSWRRKVFQS